MKFVPERLKDIRLLNHYTAEDLAERLGITKQAVSKYETGRTIPSMDILNRILEIFSLPPGYLTKEDILPPNMSAVFYRKKNRTACRVIDEAQVVLKWYYEIIMASRSVLAAPALNIPCFSGNLQIEDKALELRRFWHIDEQPIADMSCLLEENGFYIFTIKMDNDKVDGYSQMIGDCPVIVLNDNKGSRERKNFSLAHELGHLVLHTEADFDGSDQLEKEADCFAASFLMPEEPFSKGIIRKDAETFIELGKRWHVSPQAAVERCGRLGLLGENHEITQARKARLYQHFNKLKNYYLPEMRSFCSLKAVLEKIDVDESLRTEFMRKLCFPIPEIQELCQMPTVFESCRIRETESAEDFEGVQLSLF